MEYNPYVGKNPNNFIKDFFDAKETAEKRAKEKEQYNLDKTNRENLINAIKSGNKEEIDAALASYSPADYIKRQQNLADLQDQKDWQVKMADIAHQMDLEKLGIANTNAINLAHLKAEIDRINNKPTDKMRNYQFMIDKGVSPEEALASTFNNSKAGMTSQAREQSTANAKLGLETLKQLSENGSLGIFNKYNVTDEGQASKGKLSAAIAAIAPMGIQRLKDAGISGVNTLDEFMTYVGLPKNPTSKEIAGALPIIAQTLGVDVSSLGKANNYKEQSDEELLKGL